MPDSNEVKFSIIVPTYNAAKTLRTCINSILAQSYANFEVWFIDGASADETLNIIREYQDSYPNIHFTTEKDKGIYDAMNKGIDLAAGNWLYFLGSDDSFYNPDVLSAVANKAKQSKQGVIYGNVMMRGQNQWNLDNVVFDGEYSLKKILDRNICHQAIFYHKSIFKKNGYFNLKYVTCADFDFNLRCYANSSFTYIDLIVANFFVGGQSTTLEDTRFNADRGLLLLTYFGAKIFSKHFANVRLYLRQAALSPGSQIKLTERVYCFLAYTKLKGMSMLQRSNN